MCGIAGWLSWASPPDAEIVVGMRDALEHRGPDAAGVVALGPVVLGHRRLSVIDVAPTNNQPLADRSGGCWIVYNGEVYNYRELRRELQNLGSVFMTHGDTEVILEAYKQFGTECVQRLNGMFAFALWDNARQRLFIARDRLGEKPIFYYILPDGGLLFASEPKALRTHPQVNGRVDAVALGHYLSLNYTLGSRTLMAGMHRLPPAHYLLIERGSPITPRCYWQLAPYFHHKRRFKSEHEAAEALAALIDESVQMRQVSDVPLGAFLSGGVDSSTIVASMARQGSPDLVKTFSVGFREESFDELAEARQVAAFLHVDHQDRVLTPDPEVLMQSIVTAADEPLADSSFLPTYCLANFAREHVTVAMSGDGGDECFAGYETYAADRLHRWLSWLPGWLGQTIYFGAHNLLPVKFTKVGFDYKLRQFLKGLKLNKAQAHYSWRTIFSAAELQMLMLPEWRSLVGSEPAFDEFKPHFDAVDGCHYIDQALYVDIKTWMADDILVKVDRATMAHSLETRAPFLDHRVVEFAAALPVSLKLKWLRKKYLLKLSQADRLPGWVLARRKQGFNAPVAHWFDGALRDFGRDAVADPRLKEWFNRAEVEKVFQDHYKRLSDNGLKIFGLVCFALWLRTLQ